MRNIVLMPLLCFLLAAPVQAAQTGTATWYAKGLSHPDALTAASRTLPRGSRVRITNLSNGRSVVVRVNDRGPAAWTGHIIDLSRGAAKVVGIIRSGVARVRIDRL